MLEAVAEIDRDARCHEHGRARPGLNDERQRRTALANVERGSADAGRALEIRNDRPESDRVQAKRDLEPAAHGLLRLEVLLEPELEPGLERRAVPVGAERREREIRST